MLGCLGYSLTLRACPGRSACSHECAVDMPECYLSLSFHGHFNPGTAAAAARRFEVAGVSYVSGILSYSCVPGMLEAKSWGTHNRRGTSFSDAASHSMPILVVLLLLLMLVVDDVVVQLLCC